MNQTTYQSNTLSRAYHLFSKTPTPLLATSTYHHHYYHPLPLNPSSPTLHPPPSRTINQPTTHHQPTIYPIQSSRPRTVLIIQVCGHNPTGVDPSLQQWREIAEIIRVSVKIVIIILFRCYKLILYIFIVFIIYQFFKIFIYFSYNYTLFKDSLMCFQ